MNEIWRDIDGYEGLYEVSNLGRVKSFYKGERILKPGLDGGGYPQVNLWRDGKCKHPHVHRLVAEAFIPNPDGKREVNHVNGDKTDNRVENLERVTPKENMRHAFATGLQIQGENCSWAKLTNEQARLIRDNPDGLTCAELARLFGVSHQLISQIQTGKIFKSVGGTIRTKKPPSPKRIPDKVREQIRSEYVYGSHEFGTVALAKKYGFGKATIHCIVNET